MYLLETEFNDLEKIWNHCDKKSPIQDFFYYPF